MTKPLFVCTSSVDRATVHFEIPEGWQIAAPWDESAARTYAVPTLKRLIDNSLVVGFFPSTSVHVGEFDVTGATPGEQASSRLLSGAVARMGSFATKLFSGTPRGL